MDGTWVAEASLESSKQELQRLRAEMVSQASLAGPGFDLEKMWFYVSYREGSC